MEKLKTIDMETALARHFNPLINLIVPNISWGMFNHECDLLVVTKAGYAWEIEIKISLSDLKKDKLKRHNHQDHFNRIKYLYFALPYYLEKHIEHVPKRAGIIIVGKDLFCRKIKKPVKNSDYKFTAEDRYKVARLGAIRVWSLKGLLRNV